MKNLIIAAILLHIATSCSQRNEDAEKSQTQLAQVIKENRILKNTIDSLINSQKLASRACTKEFAIGQLKEYLAFYCKGCKFREFESRPSGDCSFDIAFKAKPSSERGIGWTKEWYDRIVRITFLNEGKSYSVKTIDSGMSIERMCD